MTFEANKGEKLTPYGMSNNPGLGTDTNNRFVETASYKEHCMILLGFAIS